MNHRLRTGCCCCCLLLLYRIADWSHTDSILFLSGPRCLFALNLKITWMPNDLGSFQMQFLAIRQSHTFMPLLRMFAANSSQISANYISILNILVGLFTVHIVLLLIGIMLWCSCSHVRLMKITENRFIDSLLCV